MSGNPSLGDRAFDTFFQLARDRGVACSEDFLKRLYKKLLGTRQTRKIKYSVLKKTMDRLAAYEPDIQSHAVEVFLEKDNGVGEDYLIGIARTEKKRRGGQAKPRERRPEPESKMQTASEHLERVREWLLGVYRDAVSLAPEAVPHVREAGEKIAELRRRAETGVLTASEIDKAASKAERKLRPHLPNHELPTFSPYDQPVAGRGTF